MIRNTNPLYLLPALLLFAACSSQKYSNSQYQEHNNADEAYFSEKDLEKNDKKIEEIDIEKYKSKDKIFYDENSNSDTEDPKAADAYNQQVQNTQNNATANQNQAASTTNNTTNNYYNGAFSPYAAPASWGYNNGYQPYFGFGYPLSSNIMISFSSGPRWFRPWNSWGSPFNYYGYNGYFNSWNNPYAYYYNPWNNPYGNWNPYYSYYGYSSGYYWNDPYAYNPYYNPYYSSNYWNGYGYGSSSGGRTAATSTNARLRRFSHGNPVHLNPNGGVSPGGPVTSTGSQNTDGTSNTQPGQVIPSRTAGASTGTSSPDPVIKYRTSPSNNYNPTVNNPTTTNPSRNTPVNNNPVNTTPTHTNPQIPNYQPSNNGGGTPVVRPPSPPMPNSGGGGRNPQPASGGGSGTPSGPRRR